MANLADKIEHVIVLMLENRSFDHLLGYVPGIGELTGKESNPSQWGEIAVSDGADYVLPVGPDHSHAGITRQLRNQNRGFVEDYTAYVAKQVKKDPALPADVGKHVMRCFAPQRVPVLAALAQQFVTFRRWFSSVPGETWPNRNYAHAATSHGEVDIKAKPYLDQTIFEVLAKHKKSWRIYHDGPAQAWAFPKLWITPWRNRFRGMSKLFAAIDHDELDHYSFIEPDHGLLPLDKTSNNQHPDNNTKTNESGRNFKAGEALVASVYERLRANLEVFEKTLLLVTYDEHGGFYDHVPPPPATPPDKHVWKKGGERFGFDRFGVRVPAILISPWLDPAVIDDGVWDHSSIVASLRQLFAPAAVPLTRRDGAASSFHGLTARTAMRGDLPPVEAEGMLSEGGHQMALKALPPAVQASEPTLDTFQQSLVALTAAVEARLAAETRPAVRRSRVVRNLPHFRTAGAVRKRFRSHRELATYMDYVTRRFHQSTDPDALDLIDADGRVTERPSRAAIAKAFARLADSGGQRGRVSLRTGNDLVVTADTTGTLRRIDLETGVAEFVRAGSDAVVKPTTMAKAAAKPSVDPVAQALSALGRSDLR